MRSPDIHLEDPVKVLAITGGKGGIGKTSISINLATALAASGKRVLLLDGDLGMANVDVMLGLSPRYTLAHVLNGERTLEEILVETPQGFKIVPAASGVAELAALSDVGHLSLVQAFSSLAERVDILIIDTAPGITPGVLQLSQAAQHVVVTVCDEPASLTDAYALIKVLSRYHGVTRLRVLANRVRVPGDGQVLFRKLQKVTDRFLDLALEYVGEIPEDERQRSAIHAQRPLIELFPSSPASRAFDKLANAIAKWPLPQGVRGNLEFFVERLVRRPAVPFEVVT